MLTALVRALGLTAAAAAISFGVWLGPQYFLARFANRFGHLMDYRLAVLSLQALLVVLIVSVLRVPVFALFRGSVTREGLRAVAWFTAGGTAFSLLVVFTIFMSSPAGDLGVSLAETVGKWANEFPFSGLVGRFLAQVIIAPALEETVYRGLILGFLLRLIPAWLALGLATALFASIHSNWLAASFTGLIFGVLYLRYQSLLLCVMAHSLNNLVVGTLPVLFVAYLGDAGFLMPPMSNLLALQVLWLCVVVFCFSSFFRNVFRQKGAGSRWFRMQPPLQQSIETPA